MILLRRTALLTVSENFVLILVFLKVDSLPGEIEKKAIIVSMILS